MHIKTNKALLVTGARQTGNTWLIRDEIEKSEYNKFEIQKCPETVTKIKFLVDEGSFKYVMSGSLLGVELKGITSAPVGYLTVLKMYPMDFAIEMNGKVVPIEVKSGKSYKSHKALNNFMNVADYHLDKAYVLSTYNVEKEGVITYLPIYMCYLLKEPIIEKMIIDLDIVGL